MRMSGRHRAFSRQGSGADGGCGPAMGTAYLAEWQSEWRSVLLSFGMGMPCTLLEHVRSTRVHGKCCANTVLQEVVSTTPAEC